MGKLATYIRSGLKIPMLEFPSSTLSEPLARAHAWVLHESVGHEKPKNKEQQGLIYTQAPSHCGVSVTEPRSNQ